MSHIQNVAVWMGCLLAACVVGCSENAPKTVTTTKEAPVVQLPAPPVPEEKPKIAEAPASKPAPELPASTYDSKPPYPVELHVSSPKDEQPGWLKILTLDKEEQPAAAKGQFPEQNKFVVDTQNVQRIQLHISHLPLASGKRIILRIDNQGIQIVRNNRDFVTLLRKPTGEWVTEPPPKE